MAKSKVYRKRKYRRKRNYKTKKFKKNVKRVVRSMKETKVKDDQSNEVSISSLNGWHFMDAHQNIDELGEALGLLPQNCRIGDKIFSKGLSITVTMYNNANVNMNVRMLVFYPRAWSDQTYTNTDMQLFNFQGVGQSWFSASEAGRFVLPLHHKRWKILYKKDWTLQANNESSARRSAKHKCYVKTRRVMRFNPNIIADLPTNPSVVLFYVSRQDNDTVTGDSVEVSCFIRHHWQDL